MKYLIFLIFCFLSFEFFAQTSGEWTWMSGSNISGEAVYGTQGIPGPDVTPGGNVYECRFWTDLNGNFWLYGGQSLLNSNDTSVNLWKFNTSINQWTWMKGNGVNSAVVNYGVLGESSDANNPPGTGFGESISWTDLNGNLWMYATSLLMGSMWKYDISLNQWTWMHGNFPQNDGVLGITSPLNNPGEISECPISWVDDEGYLWFIDGYNGGVMWKYDTNSNQWTRMHGTTDMTATSFGTKGVYSSSNAPGMRWTYQYWKSDDGKFYMFGNTPLGLPIPNMWAFDPAINQWAWVAGSQTTLTTSSFSSVGVFSSTNLPAISTEEVSVWKDRCNRFWGYNILNGFLWCYDPVIDQFAWMGGDLEENVVNYGTLGVSSPLNQPSGFLGNGTHSMWGMPHWTDQNGNFWMLQSLLDENNSTSSVMWRYVPPSSGDIHFSVNPDPLCVGNEATFTPSVVSQSGNYQWNLGDGTTSVNSSPEHIYSSGGNYHVSLIFSDTIGCMISDTAELAITVEQFSPGIVQPPLICKDSSFQFDAYGGSSYLWSPAIYLDDPAISNPTATVSGTTLFSVIISDSCGVDTLSVELKVKQSCEDMVIEPTNVFTPNKDGMNDLFFVTSENVKSLHLVIYNRWGQVLFDETAESPAWNGKTSDGADAMDGVYFYTYEAEDFNGEKMVGHGFLHLIRD